RARRAVLAGGALERAIPFADNDLPGIMLASAARSYLNRFAVLPGRRAVVFANNDSAYAAALDLARAGAGVTVVDPRRDLADAIARDCAAAGIELLPGHVVGAAHGGRAIRGVTVSTADGAIGRRID